MLMRVNTRCHICLSFLNLYLFCLPFPCTFANLEVQASYLPLITAAWTPQRTVTTATVKLAQWWYWRRRPCRRWGRQWRSGLHAATPHAPPPNLHSHSHSHSHSYNHSHSYSCSHWTYTQPQSQPRPQPQLQLFTLNLHTATATAIATVTATAIVLQTLTPVGSKWKKVENGGCFSVKKWIMGCVFVKKVENSFFL